MQPSCLSAPFPRFNAAVLAVVLCLPGLATAGGTAQVETGSGGERTQATVEFDGAKVRIATALGDSNKGHDSQMIFRDGKLYAIVDEGSQAIVMELSSAMKMMGGMLKQQASSPDAFGDVSQYRGLTSTGRSETVGGVRGEVFQLDYDDRNGVRQRTEVVLSTQAAAREMTESMTELGSAMSAAMGYPELQGSKALQDEVARKKLGVLRFGDEYRVLSLNGATPSASRFALPAKPTQMPSLPAGMNIPSLGGASSGSSGVSAILGEKAQRQQDRIESRSQGETDAATDRAVDKVLDKAFGKIFGGQ